MLILLKVGSIPQGIHKGLFLPKIGWTKNGFISHAFNYVGPLLCTTEGKIYSIRFNSVALKVFLVMFVIKKWDHHTTVRMLCCPGGYSVG